MKKSLLYLIIILLSSCATNTNKKSFKHIKNYTYYSGFRSGDLKAKTIDNKEYICYSDLKTRKQIAIHALDNSEQYFINVSEINKQGAQVLTYAIHSLDSIYLLSKYNNLVFLIDSSGYILKNFDFNITPFKPHFELSTPSTSILFNDTSFLFTLDYIPANKYNFNSSEASLLYAKDSRAASKLCKISNIQHDSLTFKFGAVGIYKNFSNINDLTIEGNHYNHINNQIIFTTAYSDTLYIIDPNSLLLKRKINISSDYTQTYITPISRVNYKRKPELLNENFKSNGQIRNIVYDEDKQLYYCSVNHKPKNTKTSWGDIPWSIIVLDKDFKKIDEVKMDETKYSYRIMMCSQGLLVSNYPETKDDEDNFTKNTFSLFRYE